MQIPGGACGGMVMDEIDTCIRIEQNLVDGKYKMIETDNQIFLSLEYHLLDLEIRSLENPMNIYSMNVTS